MDVAGRLPRLVDRLGEAQVDAVVISHPTNLRYLTGFTGSSGLLFVAERSAVLVTDGRYTTQAGEQLAASGVDVEVVTAPAAAQGGQARELAGGAARLGVEAAHVSWARQRTWSAEWFPGAELVPTVGLVEDLRRLKDPGEIARLGQAATIADDALAGVRDQLLDGPAEDELARGLDFEMRRLGASGPSFETIVAGGPNGAKPHHRPSARRIRPGEAVVVDFGALCDGYCSDMTRTLWVGELADPQLRRAVEVVLAAQAAGVAVVRPGVACTAVDQACREVIAEAGWADRFVHGTGHGVGLDIHEAPAVGVTSTDTLASGHVVTVEPGVYLPGVGGVRIEDTVVVTEHGCRPLTTTPKDSP